MEGQARVRFNSPQHVDTWRATGLFPRIHDDIFQMALSCLQARSVMDLCCSTGLLAHRVSLALTCKVIGVDADREALAYGHAAGCLPLYAHLRIRRDTLNDLAALVTGNRVTALLARRCMPELFGDDLQLAQEFASVMLGAGVNEIVLEGRAQTVNATNALASIHDEIAALAPYYHPVRRYGAVAYLKAA